MLPCFDFEAAGRALSVFVSVPLLLLGMIVTILAGSSGAGARARLPKGRYWLALTIGGAFGCLVLLGSASLGLLIDPVLFLSPVLSALLVLLLLLAGFLGAFTAYHVARLVSSTLTGYRCRSCWVRFHSRVPTDRCPQCADADDHDEAQQALVDFATRYRTLRGKQGSGKDE